MGRREYDRIIKRQNHGERISDVWENNSADELKRESIK